MDEFSFTFALFLSVLICDLIFLRKGDFFMSQTIEQQVIEAIRVLPETKQMQVLSYVKEISQNEVMKRSVRKKENCLKNSKH